MKITDFTAVRGDADEYLRLKEWHASLKKQKSVRLSVKIEDENRQHVGYFHIDATVFAAVLEGQMRVHADRLKKSGVEV